eukprot:RCo032566
MDSSSLPESRSGDMMEDSPKVQAFYLIQRLRQVSSSNITAQNTSIRLQEALGESLAEVQRLEQQNQELRETLKLKLRALVEVSDHAEIERETNLRCFQQRLEELKAQHQHDLRELRKELNELQESRSFVCSLHGIREAVLGSNSMVHFSELPPTTPRNCSELSMAVKGSCDPCEALEHRLQNERRASSEHTFRLTQEIGRLRHALDRERAARQELEQAPGKQLIV